MRPKHEQAAQPSGRWKCATALRDKTSFSFRCAVGQRSHPSVTTAGVVDVLGYRAEEFVGQSALDYFLLVHAEDRIKLESAIHEALRHAQGYRLRYRAIASSGRMRWLWEQGVPVVDPNNREVRAFEGHVVDITDLVANIEAEWSKKEQDVALRSLARVAQWLRSSLPPPPESGRSVGSSAEPSNEVSIHRDHPMLNSMTELPGEIPSRLAPADLNQLLRETASQWQEGTHPRCTLSLRLAKDLPRVICDRHRLVTALLALLSRAARATPPRGTVLVETEFSAKHRTGIGGAPIGMLCLRISDEGRTLSTQQLSQLFEPLADEGTGHWGLELSLAKRLALDLGGQISGTRRPEGGTSVTLQLPGMETVRPVPRTSAVQPKPRARGTVLVVDDTAIVRRTTALALERAGFLVLAANGAKEALSTAQSVGFAIDVLVTDVVMPGASGVALASTLRQHSEHLRVLYVSGYPEDSAISGEALGQHSAFLQKPFSFQDLTATVSRLVAFAEHRSREAQ